MKVRILSLAGMAGVIALASCENQGSRTFFSESKGCPSDSLLSRIFSNDKKLTRIKQGIMSGYSNSVSMLT